MKFVTIKLILVCSVSVAILYSCHKKNEGRGNNHRLDLEVSDFTNDLDSLLNSGIYIYQKNSEINNVSKYYSFDFDNLRYGDIILSGKYNKYSSCKHGEQENDFAENSNRIDVFPSANKDRILGISIVLNNEDAIDSLLNYLNKNQSLDISWTKANKKYWLHNEEQGTLIFSILESEEDKLLQSLQEYYN